MKTMLHVLRKSKEDILKVIKLSTFRQSSSTLMNFKKIVKLMCNKERSNDNLADLFTKSLPFATFKKLVLQVGMRQLKDLQIEKLKTI